MWDRLADCWWGQILIGLLVIAFAAYYYRKITELETSGGITMMWWLLAVVYKIAGKWPAVLLLGISGATTVGVGIYNFNVERQNRDG